MNVFSKACGLGRTHDSFGKLNLIGVQQLNDMALTTKGKNIHACIIQSSMHSKLYVAELEKLKNPNSMYLYSSIGI